MKWMIFVMVFGISTAVLICSTTTRHVHASVPDKAAVTIKQTIFINFGMDYYAEYQIESSSDDDVHFLCGWGQNGLVRLDLKPGENTLRMGQFTRESYVVNLAFITGGDSAEDVRLHEVIEIQDHRDDHKMKTPIKINFHSLINDVVELEAGNILALARAQTDSDNEELCEIQLLQE